MPKPKSMPHPDPQTTLEEALTHYFETNLASRWEGVRLLWETDFLPLLVLTRQGHSTGKNQYWQFPESITSAGAKFWLRFCPFSTGTGNFLSPIP